MPEAVVGAGTVLTPEQADEAVAAGARFLVSPGWTDRLLEAMNGSAVPFAAGRLDGLRGRRAAGAGSDGDEVLPGGGRGRHRVPEVARLAPPPGAVLPDRRHQRGQRRGYLALPNVGCVGGTWMLPGEALAAKDWSRIQRLAEGAAALRR